MQHPHRLSFADQHRHLNVALLTAMLMLGMLTACGTSPDAPAQQSVAPHSTYFLPAIIGGDYPTIVLYATNARNYDTEPAPSQDIVTALNGDGSVRWQYHVTGTVDTSNEKALLVQDGIAYITTNNIIAGPPAPGNPTNTIAVTPTPGVENPKFVSIVSALRTKDGTVLWQYQPEELVQSVEVTHGTAYIGVASGVISAFRTIDGTLLWHQSANPNITSLIEANGLLSISTRQYQTGNGSVYALHATDGSLAWQAGIDQQIFGGMSLVDGTIYVGGATYGSNSVIPSITLYALQASDGHVLWHTQSNLFSVTAVSNGIIYLNTFDAGKSTLFALRASDGSQLWQQQEEAALLDVQGDVLYAVNPTQGPVIALRASDGTHLWDYRGTAVDHASPQISLIADNERAYISSLYVNNGFFGSSLEVRKASDGSVLWHYPYQKVSSIFKLVDGVVYVGASTGFYQGDRHSGSVCALQASTGTTYWCHQATTGVAPLTVGS